MGSPTCTITAKPVVMSSAEKILFDMLPDYDYDQLLPFSFGDQFVKDFCENCHLMNCDLINLRIAVAGLGAMIEVANLVVGAKDQSKGMFPLESICAFLMFYI